MVDTEPDRVPWNAAEIWARVEALAESYTETYGSRPARLHVGRLVAEALEPGSSHPLHLRWHSPTPGVWFPEQPPRRGFVAHWRCHREAGGHFWHPLGTMIDWFCCACGKVTDGMPKDGTSGW